MSLSRFFIYLGLLAAWSLALLAQPTSLFAAPDEPGAVGATTSKANFGEAVLINDIALGAHSVVTADLDRDGDMDVISAARLDGQLIWYRNSGTNPPSLDPILIDVVPGAYSVFPADLNGDGRMDLAVAAVNEVRPSAVDAPAAADQPGATAADGKILWFANNGAPTPGFVRREIIGNLDYPVLVTANDLDGDGDQDLMSASRDDNKVMWYENNGADVPLFAPHLISDGYAGAVSVHSGDLDGDGDMDIVSAHERADVIAWYENEGGSPAQFSVRLIHTPPATNNPEFDYAKTVFIADLDGDGDNDVAFGSEEGNEVGWFQNDGNRDPQFTRHLIPAQVDHIKIVYASDVDLDGDLDLLTAASVANTVIIFENDGAPFPNFTPHVLIDNAVGARAVNVADLNGDGLPDVLGASRYDDRVFWFPNQTIHRSAFFQPNERNVLDTRERMRHVAAGDIDGDGDTDVASISDDVVVWYENDGAQPPQLITHEISGGIQRGRWIELADLDGDADLDVLASSTDNNTVFWFENLGGTPPRFSRRIVTQDALGVRAALAADLDNDGDLDVYSASHGDNKVAWFENVGGTPPGFVQHVVTTEALYARSVYASDLDNDGDLDLISASQQDDLVRWYENNGAQPPLFTARTLLNADGVQHVYAADMDGDGDNDILYATEYQASVGWLENLGGPAPQFAQHFVDNDAPGAHAVTAADMDHDGDMDLVAAIEARNAVIWYENNGQPLPGFTAHLMTDRAINAHGVAVADLDGDGDADVLSASREDGVAGWFENKGGQFAVGFEPTLTTSLAPGIPQQLASLIVAHRGRPGDLPVEVGTLDLIFVDSLGRRLDTTAINAAIESLALYRDSDGNNFFDPSVDAQLAAVSQLELTSDNRLLLDFPATGGNEQQIGPNHQARFFVAVTLNGVCGVGSTSFSTVLLLTARTARTALYQTPLLADGMRSLTVETNTGEEADENVLFINELMADNNTIFEDPDEPGEFPDWFEIYNAGAKEVALGGMYLSDDPSFPTQYRIPDGITVPPFGFVLFIADGDFAQGDLHVNFRLDRSGESVGLFDTDAAQNRPIDIVVFDGQTADVSIGRLPNGGADWAALTLATPGEFNTNVVLNQQIYLPLLRTPGGCR